MTEYMVSAGRTGSAADEGTMFCSAAITATASRGDKGGTKSRAVAETMPFGAGREVSPGRPTSAVIKFRFTSEAGGSVTSFGAERGTTIFSVGAATTRAFLAGQGR